MVPMAVDHDELRRRLARTVGRVCPTWLADKRDDIVQSALIRVHEGQKKGELKPEVPASYLWKTAYSATIDEIRRVRRKREVSLDATLNVGAEPKTITDPLRTAEGKEMGRAIAGCLARIHERRRIVVGLYLIGDTVTQMVTSLSWDEKKVRNLLFRGLTDLRRCLSARGFQP